MYDSEDNLVEVDYSFYRDEYFKLSKEHNKEYKYVFDTEKLNKFIKLNFKNIFRVILIKFINITLIKL